MTENNRYVDQLWAVWRSFNDTGESAEDKSNST